MTRPMRPLRRHVAVLSALAIFAACSEPVPVSPNHTVTRSLTPALVSPSVRISEFHYDNVGTDAGEAIEISGPAGTDLTGWSVVLYNGNGGAAYNTRALTGSMPTTCGLRGVVVLTYPVDGIQNGSPDGIALVDGTGTLVEFLTYEGSFTAVGGPAAGVVGTDIGAIENGAPVGQSLQRNGAGTWAAPGASSFGACNDDDEQPPPAEVAHVVVTPATATIIQGGVQAFVATATDAADQPIAGVTFTWTTSAPPIATVSANGVGTGVSPGDAQITATAPNGVAGSAALHVNPPPGGGLPDTRFSEIHYDNLGTDVNEAIEIEGPAGTDLTGWSVVLYNGNGGVAYSTRPLSGTIPATCDARGVVLLTYPQDGIQNGSPDGMALVDGSGQVVEFLSYEGTIAAADGPASGLTSTDIVAQEATSSPLGQSLQRNASNTWTLSAATPGACNGSGEPPPPPGNTISFSGRLPGDPALPVGFQDQLFATVRDQNNIVIITTVTWASETPAVATIDQDGVFTALTAGTAVLRATAADGITTNSISLPTRVGAASNTAVYAGNAEFGEPTDADPSDDFILRHPEYTASFNHNRGTPNWVSYDLELTHFGPEDRCDCFTYDPGLPASFARYTTNAYTGAGTFHGFGIDRGHMTRSFDRTSSSLDNAFTFYFSNVVPQAADLNQGPWAILENELGDFARFQNKEVYIVTGVAGNTGTLKNEGKIVIPASTWKVAVIMPKDQGLANAHGIDDLQVIAVNMPNVPGIRNVDWHTYLTTVDAIEAASGYDLLALLPDDIEAAVESNTRPPVAVLDGPYTSNEGSPVALSAAGSTDPDHQALTYSWEFGDGGTATGVSTSHAYAQDGAYTVKLVVTDSDGLMATRFSTATVSNVAPVIASFAGATLLPGETYTANGSFTDPGTDPWSATVGYGDGPAVSALPLVGKTFALSHAYQTAGTFTVAVKVNDDDASATRTQVVVVRSQSQGVQDAIALIDQLQAAGKLGPAAAIALKLQLALAKQWVDRGRNVLAIVELRAVLRQLETLVRVGRPTPADVAPLQALLQRLIASLS